MFWKSMFLTSHQYYENLHLCKWCQRSPHKNLLASSIFHLFAFRCVKSTATGLTSIADIWTCKQHTYPHTYKHTHTHTHTHTNMHARTHTSTHIHTQWKPKHIGGQILSVLGQDFPSYSVSLKESPSRHQENSILGFRPGSRKSSLVVESPEKETTAWPTIYQS